MTVRIRLDASQRPSVAPFWDESRESILRKLEADLNELLGKLHFASFAVGLKSAASGCVYPRIHV